MCSYGYLSVNGNKWISENWVIFWESCGIKWTFWLVILVIRGYDTSLFLRITILSYLLPGPFWTLVFLMHACCAENQTMGQALGCVQVDQSTVAISERFGKFQDVLDPGCHCVPWCLGSQLAGQLTLRLQQLDVRCETKTKVWCWFHLAVLWTSLLFWWSLNFV